MLLLSVLFSVALGAAQNDPCTQLCNHDGPAVCTGGSWTKPDGTCQAYLYRGHFTGNDYCYHTAASAASCPAGGYSVRAVDVHRLMGMHVTTSAPRHHRTTGHGVDVTTSAPRHHRTTGHGVDVTTSAPRYHRPTGAPLSRQSGADDSTFSYRYSTPTGAPHAIGTFPRGRGVWRETTTPLPFTGPDERLASLLAAYSVQEVEELCASINVIPEYLSGAINDASRAGLSPIQFWNRVNGPRLLGMAARPSSCQTTLVRVLLSLAAHVATSVAAVDSVTFGNASGLSRFCIDNAAAVRAVVNQDMRFEHHRIGATLNRFCPGIVDPRALRLGTMYSSIYRAFRSQPIAHPTMLRVNRARAFGDAITAINGAQMASLGQPPIVNFLGEHGMDRGGLGRDWFATVARLVFGSNSTDPAGGLFAPKEGTEYIELNLSRPFTARTRAVYSALGRFLAMSVVLRIPLGVPLPRMFFALLLNRPVSLTDLELDDPVLHRGLLAVRDGGESMVRAVMAVGDDDDCPSAARFVADRLRELIPHGAEARMGAIREGFQSLISIPGLAAIVTNDDLRSVVYGAPQISVDDLVAHTRYDGVVFSAAAEQVQWLWAWLRRSSNDVRRNFLRFVTGLSQLPVEGMAGLRRGISIVPSHAGDWAPRSHTCSFTLDMPLYSSAVDLEEWMGAAIASDGFGMA